MRLFGKSSEITEKIPTRASLRKVLATVLRRDAKLQAFCLDYFPKVADRFGDNMDRLVKLNLLLSAVSTDEILEALRRALPEETVRHESLLVFGDGSDALPTSLLDAREERNRQRMIAKVRKFWIEDVLEKSLHGEVMMDLGKEYRPDLVADPWGTVLERSDTKPQPIPKGTRMIDLFDDNFGELLILGAPGSGKTTMLLDLCRDLLRRAEVDETLPVPVIFNLSTWHSKFVNLQQWMVNELVSRYRLSINLANTWMSNLLILPLLDGLDEVPIQEIEICSAMINAFKKNYNGSGMVITCRSMDYQHVNIFLEIHSSILISPLTEDEVRERIASTDQLSCLSTSQETNHEMNALLRLPLFLNIMMLMHKQSPQMHENHSTDLQNRIFTQFIQHVLRRNIKTRGEILQTLKSLARIMLRGGKTPFFLEEIQPTLIPAKYIKCLLFIARILLWAPLSLAISIVLSLANSTFMRSERLPINSLNYFPVIFFSLLLISTLFEKNKEIKTTEILHWSVNYFKLTFSLRTIALQALNISKKGFRILFIIIGIIFLVFMLFVNLIDSGLLGLSIASLFLMPLYVLFLSALIFLGAFLYYAVSAGIVRDTISKRDYPNQGIKLSLIKTIMLYFFYIVYIVLTSLIFPVSLNNTAVSPFSATFFLSFFISLLSQIGQILILISIAQFGGLAVTRHYALRLFMKLEYGFPLSPIQRLDYCVTSNLLHKVGGGYIFIHRLLMEYFASLNDEDVKRLTTKAETPYKQITPQSIA